MDSSGSVATKKACSLAHRAPDRATDSGGVAHHQSKHWRCPPAIRGSLKWSPRLAYGSTRATRWQVPLGSTSRIRSCWPWRGRLQSTAGTHVHPRARSTPSASPRLVLAQRDVRGERSQAPERRLGPVAPAPRRQTRQKPRPAARRRATIVCSANESSEDTAPRSTPGITLSWRSARPAAGEGSSRRERERM